MSNLMQRPGLGAGLNDGTVESQGMPTFEEVAEAIKKGPQAQFDKNITARMPLQEDWTKHSKAAIDGQNETEITALAQKYMHIGDNTFAVNWRQASQRRTKFMDDDWFRLKPKDTFNADPFLCNIKAAFLNANLKKPKSNFKNTYKLVDLQFGLLNCTAMHYRYVCDVKSQRVTRLVNENGRSKMVLEQGPRKLVHQGGVATFINMFNCYPDVLNKKSHNQFEWDVYYREPARFADVINSALFNAEKEYMYEDCVIYRGVESLATLTASVVSYTKSNAEKALDYRSGSRETIGMIEIRSAYLDELKIGNQVYENVNVFWATQGGNVYPLLVEYNYLPYKPILLAINWANPWDTYGKSQDQLTYNQHSTRGFFLSALAYEVVSSIFDATLVPAEFLAAVIAAGGDRTLLMQALRRDPQALGKVIPYQYVDKSSVSNIDYRSFMGKVNTEKTNYNLQLLQQGIGMVTSEMQSTQVDLKSADVNSSTAAGVEYINSQQGSALKSNLETMAECILKPFLEMCLFDMSTKLFPEQFGLDLSDEKRQELESSPEYQQLAEQYGRVFQMNTMIPLPNGQEVPAQYNATTGKISFQITREFIEAIDDDIEVQIENNDYDQQQIAQSLATLSTLVGSLPEEAAELKTEMTVALAEQYLELYKFPKRKEMIAKARQGLVNPQMQAQQQAETQLTQAEAVKTQAQAEKYSAEAKEEATRAQSQHMNNEDRMEAKNAMEEVAGSLQAAH